MKQLKMGMYALVSTIVLFSSCSKQDGILNARHDSATTTDQLKSATAPIMSNGRLSFNSYESFAAYVNDLAEKSNAVITEKAAAFSNSLLLKQNKEMENMISNSKNIANNSSEKGARYTPNDFFISDPVLASVLNQDYEFQIGNEISRVTPHYTISYKEGTAAPNISEIDERIKTGSIHYEAGTIAKLNENVQIRFPSKAKNFDNKPIMQGKTLVLAGWLSLQWVEDFTFFNEAVPQLGGEVYNHAIQGKIVYINILGIYESYTTEAWFRYKHPSWYWYGEPNSWPLAWWDSMLQTTWNTEFNINGVSTATSGTYGYPYGALVINPLWIKVVIPLTMDWTNWWAPQILTSLDILTYYSGNLTPNVISSTGAAGHTQMISGAATASVTTLAGTTKTVTNNW